MGKYIIELLPKRKLDQSEIKELKSKIYSKILDDITLHNELKVGE